MGYCGTGKLQIYHQELLSKQLSSFSGLWYYQVIRELASKESFTSLDGWLAEAKENAPANVMLVLIGTHLDEADKYFLFELDAKFQRKKLKNGWKTTT